MTRDLNLGANLDAEDQSVERETFTELCDRMLTPPCEGGHSMVLERLVRAMAAELDRVERRDRRRWRGEHWLET